MGQQGAYSHELPAEHQDLGLNLVAEFRWASGVLSFYCDVTNAKHLLFC
jgi:hypothetical protein